MNRIMLPPRTVGGALMYRAAWLLAGTASVMALATTSSAGSTPADAIPPDAPWCETAIPGIAIEPTIYAAPAFGTSVVGTAGDDVIVVIGGRHFQTIDGGGGDDTICAIGTAGFRIYGRDGDDSIRGGDGNDSIYGHAGDDILHGERGADTLLGDVGDDDLYGDAGDDRLYGYEGRDTADGGTGRDFCNGAPGHRESCGIVRQ